MRHFLRFGWAATVGLAVGGAAVGQQTGTGSGTGTGTGSGSGSSSANSSTVLTAPPAITALDTSSGTTRSGGAVNSSNFLSASYANPYYQGRAGATGTDAPGGFGTALYNTTGGTGTGTGGGRTSTTGGRTGGTSTGFGGTSTGFGGTGSTSFGGTSTGFGGASTGFGGTGGRGGGQGFGGTGAGGFGGQGMGGQGMGFGGTGNTSAAQVIALPRPISYTASVRFATPPMTAPRMQTQVRAVLDRSISLSNPRGIEVVSDGAVVVLRGAVKDEDEARLAENMIRLTPGVRDVRNELKFPNP